MNRTSRIGVTGDIDGDAAQGHGLDDDFIRLRPADPGVVAAIGASAADRTAVFRREYFHDVIDSEAAATRRMAPLATPTVGDPVDRARARSSTPLVVLAAVATLVLLAAVAFTLLPRGASTAGMSPGPTASVAAAEIVSNTPVAASAPVVDDVATPEPVRDVPVPLPPVPLPDDADAGQPAVDQSSLEVPPTVPAPAAPGTTVPPPPPPPAPAPLLVVQTQHQLDPGVAAVTITLQNQGDAALHYEIVNDGDGFSADQPVGEIAAGFVVDVWVALDVEPNGDGPTPFQRVLDVRSDGGDARIAIDGQVEKPGHLIAEFESLPMVDYRATAWFTNVGDLALEIVGLDAPGLTVGPLPDTIAGGETLEVEVAICEGATGLPVFVPHPAPPHPLPQFQAASWVTLETDQNTESTAVTSWTFGFTPPSCTPVIGPVSGSITLGP